MSMFELAHPLGQDIEKIHGALLAGMADQPDFYADKLALEFESALEREDHISWLRVANWATKKLVWVELPMITPDDPEWLVDWGAGLEPVRQRVKVMDMFNRPFITTIGETAAASLFLKFDVADDGVAVTQLEDGEKCTYFGEFDSVPYARLSGLAVTEAGISELAKLADAI